MDEWKLYCKICLLPLVLIRQVLVCYLCFWALSLSHAITLNPKVRANIMPLYCCSMAFFWPSFLKLVFCSFVAHSCRLKGWKQCPLVFKWGLFKSYTNVVFDKCFIYVVTSYKKVELTEHVCSWFIKQFNNYFNNSTPKHRYPLYKLLLKWWMM